jgi:glycerol uptake facilitator-like aquaporin
MVAAYIGAAYWFTALTAFANPATVFGRMFSNSFSGIPPTSAPVFVIAELIGGAIGLAPAYRIRTGQQAYGSPQCDWVFR